METSFTAMANQGDDPVITTLSAIFGLLDHPKFLLFKISGPACEKLALRGWNFLWFRKSYLSALVKVVYAAVALLTSGNYMHTLGLKRPFKIENEEMAR